MKKCSRCGRTFSDNEIRCGECGNMLERNVAQTGSNNRRVSSKRSKRCWYCGWKNPEDKAYCGMCGLSQVNLVDCGGSRINIVGFCVGLMLVMCLVAVALISRVDIRNYEAETLKVHNAKQAIALLKDLGNELGFENALSELTEHNTTTVNGDSYYRLQQNYKGIPVYGKTAVCVTDEQGNVSSITGNVVDIELNSTMHPTITEEDVIKSINNYLTIQNELDGSDVEIPSLDNETLCIYVLDDSLEQRLCYCINIGFYEFIIDAQTAEILFCTQTVYEGEDSLVGYTASDVGKENGFPIEKWGENYYVMSDPTRGLAVYTFDGQVSKNKDEFYTERATIVESTDAIFGNDETESALEYEKGAELLRNVIEIHDYFSSIGFSTNAMEVRLYYNDGYDSGENAVGGTADEFGLISMGTETGVSDIDIIAHEYTHFITAATVNWTNAKIENYALNEAYSDIFGELAETWYNNQAEPNWIMDQDSFSKTIRDMRTPSSTGNAAFAEGIPSEFGWTQRKIYTYGYKYSTVISHAAYLMWNGIDGDNAKKIDLDTLAELWYRAMLMLPSDCDFSKCRQMVEWAALSVDGITDAQRKCIAEAFDLVGIQLPDRSPELLVNCDQNIRSNSKLTVYDALGKRHTGYQLHIEGTVTGDSIAFGGNIQTDIGFKYDKTMTVKNKTHSLNLPTGYYTFTITDEAYPNYSYSFTVSVNDKNKQDEIELYTDFGTLIVKVTDPTDAEETESIPSDKNRKQLLKVTSNDPNSGTPVYEFHYDGQLLSKIQLTETIWDDDYTHNLTFTYDNAGRLLSADRDDHWLFFGNDEYTYNGKGQLIRHVHYWGSSEPHSIFEYDYNSHGEILAARHDSSCDDGKHDIEYEYRYVYDDQNRVAEKQEYLKWTEKKYSSLDYDHVNITQYTYDDLGRTLTTREERIAIEGMNTDGVQTLSDAADITRYNYDYAPLVYVHEYTNVITVQIQDSVGNVIWEQVANPAELVTEGGYITQMVSDDVVFDFYYDEVEETPLDAGSLYIPVVEKAMADQEKTYYNGCLTDFDHDGTDELVLQYFIMPPEQYFTEYRYDIYDIRNGEVVTLCKDKSSDWYGVAGSGGKKAFDTYDGKYCMINLSRRGETSYGYHMYESDYDLVIYDCVEFKPLRTLRVDTNDTADAYSITYMIDGMNVSESEFKEEIAKTESIRLDWDEYYILDLDTDYEIWKPLEELLAQLKAA